MANMPPPEPEGDVPQQQHPEEKFLITERDPDATPGVTRLDPDWRPAYACPDVASAKVTTPLSMHPTAWPDPWARDPRPVRATADQMAHAKSAIRK